MAWKGAVANLKKGSITRVAPLAEIAVPILGSVLVGAGIRWVLKPVRRVLEEWAADDRAAKSDEATTRVTALPTPLLDAATPACEATEDPEDPPAAEAS